MYVPPLLEGSPVKRIGHMASPTQWLVGVEWNDPDSAHISVDSQATCLEKCSNYKILEMRNHPNI